MKSKNRKCSECKHFVVTEIGYQGAVLGKCALKQIDSPWRPKYGSNQGCLKFEEKQRG